MVRYTFSTILTVDIPPRSPCSTTSSSFPSSSGHFFTIFWRTLLLTNAPTVLTYFKVFPTSQDHWCVHTALPDAQVFIEDIVHHRRMLVVGLWCALGRPGACALLITLASLLLISMLLKCLDSHALFSLLQPSASHPACYGEEAQISFDIRLSSRDCHPGLGDKQNEQGKSEQNPRGSPYI